jgi:hypothetical protein
VLVEHLLHGAEEPVGRGGEPADALDGLGDQAGDVAGGGDVEQVSRSSTQAAVNSSSGRWPNGLR